jgi:hypothetical protein
MTSSADGARQNSLQLSTCASDGSCFPTIYFGLHGSEVARNGVVGSDDNVAHQAVSKMFACVLRR